MACSDCGYRTYGTRGWWEIGFPTCPCGGQILPTKPADLAFAGLIGPDDMPAVQWTVICRENGWDDAIQRKGAAAKAYDRRLAEQGGLLGRRTAHAEFCADPGCGRWVKTGETHCAEHSPALATIPF